MPRKAREESGTGYYHVISRGLNKNSIFKEKAERTRIANILRDTVKLFNLVIISYAIMPNHLHLMIEGELGELSAFMAKVLHQYAKYYNRRNHRTGYVFEGRFKSIPIETEQYFWTCFRYIHLNPVRGKLCIQVMDYKYSSAYDYYYDNYGIISEKGISMYLDKYGSKDNFFATHYIPDRNRIVISDIEEEEKEQRENIAFDILKEMAGHVECDLEEVLYDLTLHREYQESLKKTMNLSKRQIKEVEEEVRRKI